MRIKELWISNYRKFEGLNEQFDPRLTVIVGEPNSGKTSLLEAIATVSSGFLIRLHRISNVKLTGGDAFVSSGIPRFPISLKASGDILGQAWEWEKLTVSDFASEKILGGMIEFSSLCTSRARRGDVSLVLPLLYYAGVEGLSMTASASMMRERQDAYKTCFSGRIHFNTMEKWISQNTDQESPPVSVQLVCDAMKKAFEAFVGIEANVQVNPLTYDVEINGIPLRKFGTQVRYPVALVGDIAYRMAVLNPNLERMTLLQTGGIILIDELTYHVHREFEAGLLSLLMDLFPMAQFIVVTSNKDVIQSVGDDQMIVLE